MILLGAYIESGALNPALSFTLNVNSPIAHVPFGQLS
jgi:hypothetical protein